MKKSPRKALTVLSWLGALGIGLIVGRNFAPRSSALPNDNENQNGQFTRNPDGFEQAFQSSDARKTERRRNSRVTLIATQDETRELKMSELTEILSVGNRIDRTRQMLAYIDRLDENEIIGVIEDFREAGWVDFNKSEYSMLISAWMDRDPFTAIDYLNENDPDGWTRKLAISSWASEFPVEATAAIQGLDVEGDVNDWMVGLIEGMAHRDPAEALRTLSDLPDGETKNRAIREIIPEVVIRGVEFASEWIEQIEDPQLQRDTAKRLAQSMTRHDPESATAWLQNMSQLEARIEASAAVSEIYAQQDLEGAMNWAADLPRDIMGEAAESVARYLTREDPVEAARWLQDLGDSPDLDGARVRFLQEAGRRDPQTALENVFTLSRPNDQERYYRDILNRWRREDQGAAVAWAEANSDYLPPKVLKGILPKPPRN